MVELSGYGMLLLNLVLEKYSVKMWTLLTVLSIVSSGRSSCEHDDKPLKSSVRTGSS